MLTAIVFTMTILSLPADSESGRGTVETDVRWPGWRGPGRDGWVSDFQPPDRWPERLQRVWQLEVGSGYASPVVEGHFVYQHARQGSDEVVWAIDLTTGSVKWRKSYPAPFKMGGGGERHGKGPKSSPALADGTLFTMSITGILSAWDTETGKLLWRRDYSARFRKGHPYWGTATSPLVDGNRVIAHFGTDDRGALIAHDGATGKQIWSHGKDGASYASPILIELQGTRQIVDLTMRALVSVDCESGKLLWEYPYPQVATDQNMVTPAYHDGILLLGGENRGIQGLQPRQANGTWTVQQRWHQKEVALDMSSAVVNDGLLFGFSHYDSGRIFCLRPDTGEVLWQGSGRTGQNVAFLSIPGQVVALINDGQLRIISATSDGFDAVASYRVANSPTWAPPVLLDEGILIKDNANLTLWSFKR